MWGYLAGFVDCDGCITKSSKKEFQYAPYSYSVILTQHILFSSAMKKIQAFLNEEGIGSYFITRKSNSSFGPCEMINLTIKKQDCLIKLLEKIIPYLLIKKDKAEIALSYLKSLDLKKKEHQEAKKLERGTPFKVDRHRKWTEEEIENLISFYLEGKSNTAMSWLLRRNPHSISQKLKRLRDAGRIENGKTPTPPRRSYFERAS